MSIPESLLHNPEAVAAYERAIAQANEVTASIQTGQREFPSSDNQQAHPNARVNDDTASLQDVAQENTSTADELPAEVVNGNMTPQEWAAEQADALRNPEVSRGNLDAQSRMLARRALNSLNR